MEFQDVMKRFEERMQEVDIFDNEGRKVTNKDRWLAINGERIRRSLVRSQKRLKLELLKAEKRNFRTPGCPTNQLSSDRLFAIELDNLTGDAEKVSMAHEILALRKNLAKSWQVYLDSKPRKPLSEEKIQELKRRDELRAQHGVGKIPVLTLASQSEVPSPVGCHDIVD